MQPIPGVVYVRIFGTPSFVDMFAYPNMWNYVCHKADAQALIEKIQPLVASVQLQDDSSQQPVQVMSLDPTISFWAAAGVFNDGPGTPFDITVADLIDRATKPNPFCDNHNADGTLGGPNLKLMSPLTGQFLFYWGK